MGPQAFRQFWILNAFLVLLAQTVALVYLHRPATDYLKDFWASSQFHLDKISGGSFEIKHGSTASNFSAKVQLTHGDKQLLFIDRKGDELAETVQILTRYFVPFIFISLFGFGLSLSVFLRRQARVVDVVLKRVRGGDLGAQLPSDEFDPGNPLFKTFNEMTGQIKGLVEGLNTAETRRSELLRELAHDIRTPLTSIRFLIETVADTALDLGRESILEKLTTTEQELDYFETLVGELFLLAQVNSPGNVSEMEKVNLKEVTEKEVDRLARLRAAGTGAGKVRLLADPRGNFSIPGNGPLLQRLLRNSIENALFYAKEEVQVVLQSAKDGVHLKIRDDGKGFSEEAMALYGTRRKSRFLDARREGKASLGLGSVIVKAIASAHNGTAVPGNWRKPSGEKGGGEVHIHFSLHTQILTKKAA